MVLFGYVWSCMAYAAMHNFCACIMHAEEEGWDKGGQKKKKMSMTMGV